MSHVATLITKTPHLDDAHLNAARDALLRPENIVWLKPGIAADIVFSRADTDTRSITSRIREAVQDRVDVVVQAQETRRKRLFLADMDSTMIEQECIDELADYVGKKSHVAEITERAMRGEIEFEPALRERVALLAGLPDSMIDEVIEQRITLTSGGSELVQRLRRSNVYCCLVSGGFTHFTRKIAERLGFHENRANALDIRNGVLTGRVDEPILGQQAKLETLHELTKTRGLDPHETLAIGDGANDLAMIAAAGLGIAYHAKPKVAEAAQARFEYCDLMGVVYAMGLKDETL